MRVGFDVSQTGPRKAGCGFYADGLVRALIASDALDQCLLYPAFGDHFFDPEFDAGCLPSGAKVQIMGRQMTPMEARATWHRSAAELEKQLGEPDIVHANNYFAPLQLERSRLVYTLYDLSFLENHDWTTEANRIACFTGVFWASVCADWLISISQYTKRCFLQIFPHYPADRITIVHPASRFSPRHLEAVPKSAARLKRRRFWLSVGTLEPRKNYQGILRAYAELRRRSPNADPLVVAGGQGWLTKGLKAEVEALQLSDSVLFLGYVDDAELCWLYRNARCLVYPSLYEGFGMPVLEAMSCGTAAIASNGLAFPEIVGRSPDAAHLLVDPFNCVSIADAMQRLSAASDAELDCLGEAAKKVAEQFSWTRSATALVEAYEAALSKPKAFA